MPRNPLTTGRIGRVVYGLRHWKLTLFVAVVIYLPLLVTRFVVGRDLRGGRTTDAVFVRGARDVRAGWWANQAGAVRAALRIAVVAAVLLWWVNRPLVIVVGCLALVVVVWRVVLHYLALWHERTVLKPVWPAVAGIIGVPDTTPPRQWLDIPHNMAKDPDAEIVVGLRSADADDERRVAALVQLFDQRFGGPFMGAVDYARRLVHIRPRPDEPNIWPAVASILGVDPAELAANWCEVDVDPDSDSGKVRVRIPATTINQDPLIAALKTLVSQRFGGEWAAKSNRVERFVDLHRKRPIPDPPKFVDFLADIEAPQEVN
jgi:hypothetical protein